MGISKKRARAKHSVIPIWTSPLTVSPSREDAKVARDFTALTPLRGRYFNPKTPLRCSTTSSLPATPVTPCKKPAPPTPDIAMADVLSPEDEAAFKLDIIANNAAEAFTDAYYYIIEKERSGLASLYCPKLVSSDNTVPYIVWNGKTYNDGADFQSYIEGVTHTHFELEGLDCNILNPKSIPASAVKGGTGNDADDIERRMSIQVVTMGSVRLETPLTGPIREFSETFVLIPNPEKLPSSKISFEKGWQKEWLIQTQNFRFTEWGANESAVVVKEVEMKANGEDKVDQKAKGIAAQFAAAGLLAKGKK